MSSQPTVSSQQVAKNGPVPPAMHWFLLAFLTVITFGIFGIIWAFVQASFVKKLSPKCNGRGFLFLTLALNIVSILVLMFLAVGMRDGEFSRAFHAEKEVILPQIASVAYVLITILFVVAMFRMRSGLQTYYNSIEPIQLRLSAAMTFFFNIYYFQYQFRRIAQWKKSGAPIAQSIGGIAVQQPGV
jgi:hypothetical protein